MQRYTLYVAGQKQYTVNLYHTTCSLLIKGTKESDYVDHDLPRVENIVKSIKVANKVVDIHDLNTSISDALYMLVTSDLDTCYQCGTPSTVTYICSN